MSRSSGITTARAKYGLPAALPQPHPKEPSISLGTLIECRAYHSRQWLNSPAYQIYVTFFKNTVTQSEKLSIKNAMCLGLGSFSHLQTESKISTHEKSMMQLVAFESWIALLRARFDISEIFIQDPAFTDLDREFLETHGFKVIDSPASDNILSDCTFLYLPCVDKAIIDSCIARADPGLLINAGDLTDHYRQYRTLHEIKALFESDGVLFEQIDHLKEELDAGYSLRVAYMHKRAVEYLPCEDPSNNAQKLAIYWVPYKESEHTSFRKDHPHYLSPKQARKYWDELMEKDLGRN